MSELRITSETLVSANLGPLNPLPILQPPGPPSSDMVVDASVSAEARRYLGYGTEAVTLPYRMQDGYDRQREPRSCRVAILENRYLRAMFLLDWGGRLWSLIHKPTGRELLYRNPVIQPANLGVRNAWFSGGVEWNAGVRGHTPMTCSPVFAAQVKADDGTPVLRLYEWERYREIPYQIDLYLPEESPWLLVRVRLRNPHDREIPMYWWSNISVPEAPEVRVLMPAEACYNHSPERAFQLAPYPCIQGVDVSYPTRIRSAWEYFAHIPENARPWITALDGAGCGLVQASTARLRGRKLWCWGMSPGGRHWEEFLSVPGQPYIEIQAGLARTQHECLPMPAGADWSWLEAYGLLEVDPAQAHSTDWTAARRAVEIRLEQELPRQWLESEYQRTAAMADRPPERVLHHGSGWGALELRRRKNAGLAPFCSAALVFAPESLSIDQAPWLALLEAGALPETDPTAAPGAWMVQNEWRQLLENTLQAGRGDHWTNWLHLGVMHYHHREGERAREAWQQSLARKRNVWALRNLAVLASHEKRLAEAADRWMEAHLMAPGLQPLAIECCRAWLDANRTRPLLQWIETLPSEIRNTGRIRLYEVRAIMDTGDLDRAESILISDPELIDLREGEAGITDLWFAIQEQRLAKAANVPVDDTLRQRVRRECAPPAKIDFRMKVD